MRLGLLLFLPAGALAHMVSMSTGELKIDGRLARYELRMPSYEAAHVRDPERTLFDHIHFRSGGAEGRITQKQCASDKDNLNCAATYEFASPVDQLEIECTFASVTVPNHIHLLRAYRADKSDQAVFDLSYTTAEIRFRPIAPWEIFVRESGAGFFRAIAGFAPLLFLVALALAARTFRELVVLALAFLIGEGVACALAASVILMPSPRFIEAAASLTIAYLAFEIALLPTSGQRWLVVGVLGLFHGAYFSLFLTASGYGLPGFLSGVIVGEVVVLTPLYLGLSRLIRGMRFPRVVPAAATVLMTIGVAWFVARVWN